MSRTAGVILGLLGSLLAVGCAMGSGQARATPTVVCATKAAAPAKLGSLDELIATSAVVVIGTIERVPPARLAEDLRMPVTEFDLHAAEVLKGSLAADTVRVRQFGGAAGGCRVAIVGYMPKPGDHGAYFLADDRDGSFKLASAEQGAFVLDALGRDAFNLIGSDGSTEPFSLKELRVRLGGQ